MTQPFEITLQTGLRLQGLKWLTHKPAPSILMVHGWLDNAASFINLAQELRSSGEYNLWAVDLPGHGQSDWFPRAMSYHYINWLEVMGDVVNALELEPGQTHLVGHSMGASITSLYASIAGAKSVTMIEGLGPLTNDGPKIVTQAQRALYSRAEYLARTPREVFDREAAIDRIVATRPYLHRKSAALLADRQLMERQGKLFFSYDPRVQAPSLLRLSEAQTLTMFGAIEAPVLLLEAKEGMKVPRTLAEARMACLGDLKHEEVPGGHHTHMDHSAVCATLIGAHIQGTR